MAPQGWSYSAFGGSVIVACLVPELSDLSTGITVVLHQCDVM